MSAIRRPNRRQPSRGRGAARRSRPVRTLFIWMGLFSSLILFAALAGLFYYASLARRFDLNELGKMPERTMVYDINGELIGRLHGANRIYIPLEKSSRFFLEALLAREDKSFYDHSGVDYRSVARAVGRNIRDREFVQGASTITMQLARNSYGLTEKTLHRKFLEVMLTRRIERTLSKNRILELYINRIYFGSGLYGLERACQAYFGKTAAQIDLGEAALLAGIIRSPNRFSPFRNEEGALQQRDVVLDRMQLLDYITEAEAVAAKRAPMYIQLEPTALWQENYAMDYVRRELERVLWDEEYKETGGLTVYTTLNRHLQLAAEQALENRLAKEESSRGYPHPTRAQYERQWNGEGEPKPTPYMQGSIVVLDNATGGVAAIVGGRQFQHSRYNRALHAKRQVGSVFKPFVFAAAYELSGLLPQVLINDDPISPGELPYLARPWSPRNSDHTYRGFQPAGYGLVRSRNTMTVRVGERVGVAPIVRLAHELGLTDRDQPAPDSPVSYIGGFESTPLQVTAGYSIFPNQGIRNQPHLFRKLIDRGGNRLALVTGLQQRVMTAGATSLVSDSLQEVMEHGTGAASKQLGWDAPAGGKTGTTDDYRDAWFVGYTSHLTCGVWIGMDNNETTIDGGYGSRLALPVWVDVMESARQLGFDAASIHPGPPRRTALVCKYSGAQPTGFCEAHRALMSVSVPEDLLATRPRCLIHQDYPRWTPPPDVGPRRPERPRRPDRSFLGRLSNWFR